VRAGVEGFLHSIRDQEVDDEFIKLAKERNVGSTEPRRITVFRSLREWHAGVVRRAVGA